MRSKGSKYERHLVDWFDDAGYAVMKSPSSGSGTSRDQPDVLVVKNGTSNLAIEVKYIGDSSGRVYLDPEELSALSRFSHAAQASPIVAVRWKMDPTFYLFEPHAIEETQGESDTRVIPRHAIGNASAALADGSSNSRGDWPAEYDDRQGPI